MSENPYANQEQSADAVSYVKRRRFPFFTLFLVVGALCLIVFLLLPMTRRTPGAAKRTQCRNNLKQIGLALYNYADMYGSLPPASTVDANGRLLHSWRTLILPFIDQKPLYDSIDLSQAWNHPVNATAYGTELHVFHCPAADLPPGFTAYLAVTATAGCFEAGVHRQFKDVTDGVSSTLMVVEVPDRQRVHWMAPVDAGEELILNIDRKSVLPHHGGSNGLLMDGSVRFVSAMPPKEQRRALISIAGNDDAGEF